MTENDHNRALTPQTPQVPTLPDVPTSGGGSPVPPEDEGNDSLGGELGGLQALVLLLSIVVVAAIVFAASGLGGDNAPELVPITEALVAAAPSGTPAGTDALATESAFTTEDGQSGDTFEAEEGVVTLTPGVDAEAAVAEALGTDVPPPASPTPPDVEGVATQDPDLATAGAALGTQEANEPVEDSFDPAQGASITLTPGLGGVAQQSLQAAVEASAEAEASAQATTELEAALATERAQGADGDVDATPETDNVETARVFFANVEDGATVQSPVLLEFGYEGLTVEPAGEVTCDTCGHFHVLIDTTPVQPGIIIPNDDQHLHFGQGQTEAEIELPPGEHRLVLQFANGIHAAMPYTAEITVVVE